MLSVVVLISGSGSNLLALLQAADNPLYGAKIMAVGSDNPADGLAHAEQFGVPTFVVSPQAFESREAWADMLLANINHFKPDLVVLAGFMRILPSNFVAALSPNLINTHPSLLPLFPGGHAVRDALEAGVTTTGVTIHIVDEGVDTGPHIAQREVEVVTDDTEYDLHERIKKVERELLVATVKDIAEQKIQLSSITK
ncbi:MULTISPECIES: phosphoribosylglycinamide formyltransferase [Rhodoluna]|jgi:phosphoribosylglycinamide formyltransferase 1|uniref:phosphoribosylglycinamide formyltransferase n=1 Tax=Rhodoluna TaxID=529883 RepID=UPI001106A5F0|nr:MULTISPECIES: phosphoribosylglycinamide formyltransferase [Rhodoluna]BDS48623.1 phosphoribosylglycinamide formyltransferase [Rhodoluna sp. KAS3]